MVVAPCIVAAPVVLSIVVDIILPVNVEYVSVEKLPAPYDVSVDTVRDECRPIGDVIVVAFAVVLTVRVDVVSDECKPIRDANVVAIPVPFTVKVDVFIEENITLPDAVSEDTVRDDRFENPT